MSDTPLVHVRDVHKHFTRGTERIDVLKGVTLDIPEGDFLALMGPSGSGKTTLLNLLGGIDSPTGGTLEIAGVSIGSLSGGQEQRVAIARAIVTDPTLLLCDEPTGDLDRKAGDEILDLLQALNRDHGKTIVMVTHDPHAAARAKRTLHLEKGVLVSEVAA